MTLRRGIPVLIIALFIAGCTRDAGVQPFEPAAPGDVEPTTIAQDATPTDIAITIEGVDAQSAATEDAVPASPTTEPTDAPATATEAPTDLPLLEAASETPTDAPPTATDVPPTSTTEPPTATEPSVATATEAEVAMAEATTDDGIESMVEETDEAFAPPPRADVVVQATATALPTSTPIPPTTDPLVTPTQDSDLPGGEDVVEAEGVPQGEDDGCTYTVRAGDNAFRIAVNNNITLNELRQANPSLAATNPILQPGDELEIPGCGEGTDVITPEPAETDEDVMVEGEGDAEDPATPVPDGFIEYTVTSGDTLLAIA
ncbi:MAG: LysM peptidoglycan-binding domain-containing protein, partial [Chloroflexota bacterium]